MPLITQSLLQRLNGTIEDLHMNALRSVAIVSTIVALLTPQSTGTGMHALDIERLLTDSDFVAVGTIESVSDLGEQAIVANGKEYRAMSKEGMLKVDTVLKGEALQSPVRFVFSIPEQALDYRGVLAGSYRVVFLRKTSSGSFEFADHSYPTLAAVPGVSISNQQTGVETILNFVEAVLVSKVPVSLKHEAISELRNSNSPSVARALRSAANDANLEISLDAVSELLARNDISAMPLAERYLVRPQPQVPTYLLRNISAAIESRVKDPRAIPALTRLLSATDIDTVRAAASALRATGVTAALPSLARALKSPDFQTRYYAIIGMAEISNQPDWRPSVAEFRSAEKKYLDFWQSWAEEHLG
jgi:hypothetical protein